MLLSRMPSFSKEKVTMLRDIPSGIFTSQTQTYTWPRPCSFPNRSSCVASCAHSQSLPSAQSGMKFLSWILVPDTDAFVLITIFGRTQSSWCKGLRPQLQTDTDEAFRSKQSNSCGQGFRNRPSGCRLCRSENRAGTARS